MLYTLATGQKIDENRTERFWNQMDRIYENPFVKKPEKPMTTEEIKQYILRRLEE